MNRLHLSIFTALICLFTNTSYAMLIVSPSGVSGLEINGTSYDIAIGDMDGQTAEELFGGTGLSVVPSQPLLDINNVLALLFANIPGLTGQFFDGCEQNPPLSPCFINIPSAYTDTYLGGVTYNFSTFGWNARSSFNIEPDNPASGLPAVTFGVVTRTPVPIPATLALLGLGLAGLGITRRGCST